MNEKEKKAIENCRLLLMGDITVHIQNEDGATDYYGEVNKLYNEDLETVLNLIEKQQAEIESLEQEKQEAWEEWNNIDNYCEQEKQKYKAEIEKKDKIINLMAKDIKEADKFLDSMGYLGEYEDYTIEGIIEEYNQEIEKGE